MQKVYTNLRINILSDQCIQQHLVETEPINISVKNMRAWQNNDAINQEIAQGRKAKADKVADLEKKTEELNHTNTLLDSKIKELDAKKKELELQKKQLDLKREECVQIKKQLEDQQAAWQQKESNWLQKEAQWQQKESNWLQKEAEWQQKESNWLQKEAEWQEENIDKDNRIAELVAAQQEMSSKQLELSNKNKRPAPSDDTVDSVAKRSRKDEVRFNTIYTQKHISYYFTRIKKFFILDSLVLV